MTFNVVTKFFGANALRNLAGGTERSVRAAAEKVQALADNLAPERTGRLIDSSFVDASGDRATVGYDVPYAVPLHEHPEYNFTKGGGKWLERALDESHGEVLGAMAEGMRGSIG